MDVSVKKLSEILKIDPEILLEKMINAGLQQKSVDDLVSNEDKQKLLSFIRSSKDSNSTVKIESPPQAVEPKKVQRKTRQTSKQKTPVKQEPKIDDAVVDAKKSVNINGSIKVNDLSRKLNKRGNEVVKKLMELGEMASLNDEIDQETAVLVSEEFGFQVNYKAEQSLKQEEIEYPKPNLNFLDGDKPTKRHPVVTVMGHVDHGKTSLLDSIKSTNVVDGESGGITQHIAAYEVKTKSGKITFIDTPGHEAFTSMRARGANTTDIVILVVAANDSVMPQTEEAINHAKAAEVPIIVAINKVDLDGADIEKVKGDLAKHELVSEEWGGKNQMLPVSALKSQGIDKLLEAIELEADVLELKAPHKGNATGTILESEVDKFKGSLGTFLVQKGTLKVGDIIVAGEVKEKISKMRIIIKSDVAGTSEAIVHSLTKLGNDEVEVDVVFSGVGGITESDVNLAATTNSKVVGFNVRSDNNAKKVSEDLGIEISYYSVIYDLIEDVKRLLSGLLEPIFSEKILGLAQVKEVFKSSEFGMVAGCIVTEGSVKREKHVRVLRDNVVIHEGELDSLRRVKDDVKEVQNGTECGIGIKNYIDIKSGDIIENFEQKEEKRSL